MPARSIRSSRVTVVSHAHGVKPGRGNAPQHAFEGQPFRGSYSHFHAQAAVVDARRHDDLHRLKPGWLLVREQHDRASLIEVDPPDFTALHVSSWHETAGERCVPVRDTEGVRPRLRTS